MIDFGAKLRGARERRGVSLRQIAETTKISVAALEALERNDPSRLPGGIFRRAFVRSYAAEVGLDPEATVREFLERFNLDPAPLTLEAAVAATRSWHGKRLLSNTFLTIIAATLVLAAIIFFLTWPGARATARAFLRPRITPGPAAASIALDRNPRNCRNYRNDIVW
jgi:cytoskeletal protein RodZ